MTTPNCYDCMNLKVKRGEMRCKYEKHQAFVPMVTEVTVEKAKLTHFKYAEICVDFEGDEPFNEHT